MPVVSMPEILGPAFEKRYGVGAFNIVNDLTMLAVLVPPQQQSRRYWCRMGGDGGDVPAPS